ncbi:glyceraldehyde-3-phosphate dehydrogenase 1 [Chytriomyces hyalinus]|nr:glyceraldehyde-3-phosphate dehydrogenase 1 [Chytriomyces hyalinus]
MECSLKGVDVGDSVEMALDADLVKSYANLVSLLRSEPAHLASLAHAISLNEMNACAESTIFSIYGNQFNRREECLLLSLLQRIMSIQFDKANNFGSVMRANTPTSRMLSSYTRRRAGAQYLRHTVAMLMTHMVELGDTVLEINPLKLDSNHPAATRKSFSSHRPDYEPAHSESFYKSPIRNVFSSLPRKSSMSAFKPSSEVVDDRVQLLAQLVDRFLDTLIESIEHVPYEIRWLCKQIWMIAKAKFPHESESNIASLVGGFFLLRYINPAIVSPELILKPSELDPVIMSPNGRRTLTLVAKALQMIANKPSAVKETYMAPLIPLIQEQKIRVAHFFHRLCNVEDFQTLATKYEDECSEDCFAVFKDSDAIDLQIRVDELQRLCGLLELHLDRLDPVSAECIQPILESISHYNPSQLSTPLQRLIVTLELSPPAPSSASHPSSDLNNANPGNGSDHAKNLFRHLLLALLRNQSDSDLFSPFMTDTNTSSSIILSILLNHAMETYHKDSHLFTLGEKARVALEEQQQGQQEAESESVVQAAASDADSIVESLCFDMEQLTQRCCRLLEEIDELETVLYALLQTEKDLHEKVCERDRRMHRLSSSSRIKSIWSYIVGK